METKNNGMTQFRLENGEVVNVVEWKDMPRWSTADLLTGFDDERIELFTYNTSDDVASSSNITVKRTATDLDTNVALNNAMASSEEMYIYNIVCEYIALGTDPDANTDATTATSRNVMNPLPIANQLAELQRHLKFEIEISMKVVFETPLAALNTGFGVQTGFVQQAQQNGTNLDAVVGNAGSPSQSAVKRLAIPIHFGGQEKGTARLRNPSADAVNFGLASGVIPDTAAADNVLYRARIYFGGLYKQPAA